MLRYACHRSWLDNGEEPCLWFAGLALDEAITCRILGVLEPAAVEAAVLASEQESRQQDEILAVRQREREAARYTAQRAEQQDDTTDPENRWVASELEGRWNQALRKVQEVEPRIQPQRERRKVAPATREEFENLAGELEAMWKPPGERCSFEETNCADLDGRGGGGGRWSGRRDHRRPSWEGGVCTRNCACLTGDAVTVAPPPRKRS